LTEYSLIHRLFGAQDVIVGIGYPAKGGYFILMSAETYGMQKTERVVFLWKQFNKKVNHDL